MDRLTKEQRSKNMQAVKSKGSKIEILLGKALCKLGLRYRKNDLTVLGKPDFVFKKYKVAVFCDSEFWHGKNWELRKNDFKSNREFWIPKIEQNIARDFYVNKELLETGWTVIRFWGNEIKQNAERCAQKVLNSINTGKK